MSNIFWIVLILVVGIWSWIGWEIWNAPIMPDDYDMGDIEEEIWKDLNQK